MRPVRITTRAIPAGHLLPNTPFVIEAAGPTFNADGIFLPQPLSGITGSDATTIVQLRPNNSFAVDSRYVIRFDRFARSFIVPEGTEQVDIEDLLIDSALPAQPYATVQAMIDATINAIGAQDRTYLHYQAVPSTEWIVDHGLGKYPTCEVLDSTGRVWHTTIEYIPNNLNRLYVRWSAPTSGSVACN